MFHDEEYIDEELDKLKDMIENNTFKKNKANNFISYSDLEDDFSHNEIDKAQLMFMKKARNYLSLNHSGKYAMWCDWCVHITTIELYREIMWKNTNYKEDYIKLKENKDIIS